MRYRDSYGVYRFPMSLRAPLFLYVPRENQGWGFFVDGGRKRDGWVLRLWSLHLGRLVLETRGRWTSPRPIA